MNSYIAFTFETAEQAAKARLVLRDLQNRNELCLYDVVVMAKDDSGPAKRQRDRSGAPIIGAMAGALIGLLPVFAFPIVAILAGAAAGGLLAGLLFDQRIGEDNLANVERHLRPGRSALLLLISGGDVATLGLKLRPFHARVLQSTLPPQLQATLLWSIK